MAVDSDDTSSNRYALLVDSHEGTKGWGKWISGQQKMLKIKLNDHYDEKHSNKMELKLSSVLLISSQSIYCFC